MKGAGLAASRLLVISAPSGAGKTTLCARLLREFPELVLSISCTTRAPRGQEQHGREYLFLTKEEFESKIKSGSFAEWAEVHGNYYGTLRSVIDESRTAGKSVLFDIDVQGAASLRAAYPKDCFTIFVAPPSLEELEKRLRGRGTETEAQIQKRLTNAREEMKHLPTFDAVIKNDAIERAYTELKARVSQEIHG